MNKQEIFDRAVCGVYSQGKKSISGEKFGQVCAYRGNNGLKCAIGHIITDEQIEKYKVDNSSSIDSFSEELIEVICSDDDAEEFLIQLQDAHDAASTSLDFKTDFLSRANFVATRFNLNPWTPKT